MAERPLLSLLKPTGKTPQRNRGFPPREKVGPLSAGRQGERLGPKFDRLSRVLPDPQKLSLLRNDPAAIAPERALVFEIASEIIDFDRARRNVNGLEFLGEDQDELPPDEDFFVQGSKHEESVKRCIYFTMPDARALQEIVRLWKLYQRGEDLERGKKEWKKVFDHLADIRPWGPKDRVSEEAKASWSQHLKESPDEPIRFEVEFWFRVDEGLRNSAHRRLRQLVDEAGGQILDQSTIFEIRYDAALLEVRSEFIQKILQNPNLGLATFDEVMVLLPQSLVTDSREVSLEDTEEIKEWDETPLLRPPVAALLDGLPMAQHRKLADRLTTDDPDGHEGKYGRANEQVHGTSMASLIIHGDLNSPSRGEPIRSRLYVRPVMYPQPSGFDERRESMPLDRLTIDLVWRSFIRMFDGDGGEEPTAPTVKVVNMSFGDMNRRFSGVLSLWARLIDYLSWRYRVLILVSAGNILDSLPLNVVAAWPDFEAACPAEREALVLEAILRNRADRKLLAPSESINALTVGACHVDALPPNGSGLMAIDPYQSTGLPNPSSALGLGYLRGVKPEILMPGGKEHVKTTKNRAPISVTPATAGYFGIGAAAPGASGEITKQRNCSGTSVATALATHGALKILDMLEEIPGEPPYPAVSPDHHAVILKTLLVHTAKWNVDLVERITELSKKQPGNTNWRHHREDVARFLGFGTVDLEQVLECAERRATLIGGYTIQAKTSDEFRIPLPPQIENVAGFRAVTATVGWFTPLNIKHRMYRMVKFKVEPGSDKSLSLGVKNSTTQPPDNAFGKGTVFHRRWEGNKARAFVDDGNLVLNVTCNPAAGEFDDDSILYGLAVTLEVGADVHVPVYEEIKQRLLQTIAVPVRG